VRYGPGSTPVLGAIPGQKGGGKFLDRNHRLGRWSFFHFDQKNDLGIYRSIVTGGGSIFLSCTSINCT
jgi:hypothetical protein